MPLPNFPGFTPRTDDGRARFSIQEGVRQLLNGSSIYSPSPNPSARSTPKFSFGFLRRSPSNSPDLSLYQNSREHLPRVPASHWSPLQHEPQPLEPQHTAGSYQREIGTSNAMEDPEEPRTVYTRQSSDYVDPETEHMAEIVSRERRSRKRKHRRRHRHQQGWVRKGPSHNACLSFIQSRSAKGKFMALLISGLFLIAILTIYLSIALSRPHVGQEVHILFILVILCTTIFFCHSLIRLCMLALRPPRERRPRIPSMTGPDGFKPIHPIRVHLARDEEMGTQEVPEEDDEKEPVTLKAPPPAYGLWRSSVRADPNLLHWQRVAPSLENSPPSSNSPVLNQPAPRTGEHRPPSYVSDDGVSYIVDAVPRSIAPSSGMSDIHPAYRTAF